ncbi:Tripartite tricarboxylate transporter family receptor [Pigmentiphaga humi]|uniref:Tripartite tricarboxylate transporter family receptor n=1 Tax=Pigmentiphaga humi TaxID=2478468 RepID=A0A3P4B0I8_9BURK|nr:tripartite tricarboxylate transporter substrate binding protein [Pigmentiphaga humi]VCU69809.1 Tripartite tricarboxylate transporter family receptor [Pigmentiphaga humi]
MNIAFFRLSLTSAAILAAAAPGTGAAQPAFPTKPVMLVVPFTPSSGSDIIARVLAPKLSERWGQPVIVDNRPGASGNIGAQHVAGAAPDGHTLLMAINSFTMTPFLYKSLPFDAVKDFTPVGKLAEAGYTFAVNADVPARDMKSMLEYIKKNDGKINYGTPGSGTPQHLAMELFKSHFGVDIMHVPYKGISGALTGIGGGQVQMMFATVHSMRPTAQAGKVHLLAVTGAERSPLVPDVPTFREQGITVMDSVDAWYGVIAPAGTPADVVNRINRDFIDVLKRDDVRASLAAQGLRISTDTPEEFRTLIANDLARWKKVIADASIKAD